MNRNACRQTEQPGHQRIESPDHGSDVLNIRVSVPIDCMLILRFSLVAKSNVENLPIPAGICNEERPSR